MILKKRNFTYYFKKESVVLVKKSKREGLTQAASFNVFSLQSRKKFKDFKVELANSKTKEFDCYNDIYGLATKYGVRATGAHVPSKEQLKGSKQIKKRKKPLTIKDLP